MEKLLTLALSSEVPPGIMTLDRCISHTFVSEGRGAQTIVSFSFLAAITR